MLRRLTSLVGNSLGKDEYALAVRKAVADGVITDVEVVELQRLAARLKMDASGVRSGNIRALNLIVEEIIADGIAENHELAYLHQVCLLLGLSQGDIQSANAQALSDAVYVHQANLGNLPVIPPQHSPMPLNPGETLHLIVGTHSYGKVRVGSTTTYGGSSIRFRVAKGVSFGFSGGRATSQPVHQTIVDSRGPLVLTSERLAYLSRKKAFNKPWKQISALEIYDPEVVIHFTNRQNAAELILDDRNTAVRFGAIGHALLNR